MKPYPLKFDPIYKKRIWGGRRLEEAFGKKLPPGEKIGESWELADLPDDKSVIANGDLAGQTIASAIEQHPAAITGREDFSLPFPLLIKLLDAQDILSVQVHPDARTCQRMRQGRPKTECWYIIAAEPGAYIYKGLRKTVTRERLAEAVQSGQVEELLEKIVVSPGQCHFLPAGTPHSIGAGLIIAEIQTPSDTTYRLFDWNRTDENGRARDLHIEQAMESIHFDADAAMLPVTTTGTLVNCEYFRIDKDRRGVNAEMLFRPERMKTLIILTGAGLIYAPDGDEVEFRAGDTLLVPASYEGAARFEGETDFLTVTI